MNQSKYTSMRTSFIDTVKLLSLAFLVRTIGFGLYQVPSGSMETTMLVGERFLADKLSYWFVNPKRLDIISFNAPAGTNYPHFNYSDQPIKRFWQKFFYGPDNWCKRVIGLPGETVRGTIEDGKPVIYIKNNSGEFKLDQSKFVNPYPLILVGTGYVDRIKQLKLKSFNPEIKDAQGTIIFDSPEQFYILNKFDIHTDYRGNPRIRFSETPLDYYGESNRHDKPTSDIFEIVLGDDEYWVMGDNRLGSYDSRAFGPLKREMIHGKMLLRLWSSHLDEPWFILEFIKHPIDFFKKARWSRCFQFLR